MNFDEDDPLEDLKAGAFVVALGFLFLLVPYMLLEFVF